MTSDQVFMTWMALVVLALGLLGLAMVVIGLHGALTRVLEALRDDAPVSALLEGPRRPMIVLERDITEDERALIAEVWTRWSQGPPDKVLVLPPWARLEWVPEGGVE